MNGKIERNLIVFGGALLILMISGCSTKREFWAEFDAPENVENQGPILLNFTFDPLDPSTVSDYDLDRLQEIALSRKREHAIAGSTLHRISRFVPWSRMEQSIVRWQSKHEATEHSDRVIITLCKGKNTIIDQDSIKRNIHSNSKLMLRSLLRNLMFNQRSTNDDFIKMVASKFSESELEVEFAEMTKRGTTFEFDRRLKQFFGGFSKVR